MNLLAVLKSRLNPCHIPVLFLLLALAAFLEQVTFYVPQFSTRFASQKDIEEKSFNDFMVHWSVSSLMRDSQASLAYTDGRILANIMDKNFGVFPDTSGTWQPSGVTWRYFYPPPSLLMIKPLASWEFQSSAILFLGLTFFSLILISYCYAGAMGIVLGVSAPAAWICLWEGQNGLLTATFLGAFLFLLPRFKAASGATLALLVVKPHLAIAAPFALLAGREKKAFIAAAVMVCILLGVTTLLLGPKIWLDYFEYGLSSAKEMLTTIYHLVGPRLVSLYGTLMISGKVGVEEAMVLQLLLGFVVVACTAWVFMRTTDRDLRAAALALSAVMISPMAYDYDLPITLLAVLALLRLNVRASLQLYEWMLLGMLYFLPLLTYPEEARHLGFNPVLVIMIGLFGAILFRVRGGALASSSESLAAEAKLV